AIVSARWQRFVLHGSKACPSRTPSPRGAPGACARSRTRFANGWHPNPSRSDASIAQWQPRVAFAQRIPVRTEPAFDETDAVRLHQHDRAAARAVDRIAHEWRREAAFQLGADAR